MAELRKKVKLALDEARMLVLGSQVLLGFQFRSFFESSFDKAPRHAQLLKFAGLDLMLLAILLLILPAAYHRIVEQGEATQDQHRFTTDVMDFALLPFALVLGMDCFVAFESVFVLPYAIAVAGSVTAITLFCWYGLQWIKRARDGKKGSTMSKDEGQGRTPLKDKIEHVLTECRVVLPGVQALIGFQFATTLMEGFEKLPDSSKQVHLGSLLCIAAAMVLLMMPAARHRMVEEGEESEEFHRFASYMLLASLLPLALGVSGDLFVVTRKLTDSVRLGIVAAVCSAVVFLASWFGLMIWIRCGRRARWMREAAQAI
jgi:hypothetical protein